MPRNLLSIVELDRNFQWRVTYNGEIVYNGRDFRPSQVVAPPRVMVIGNQVFSALFTLIMVDLDAPAPNNPSRREYLHWLVINIPETLEASVGQELVRYEGPRPEIGIHRIAFVLYAQSRRIVQGSGNTTTFRVGNNNKIILCTMPRGALELLRIIGDAINPFVRTNFLLRVRYDSGVDITTRAPNATNRYYVRPSQVINQPLVRIGGDSFTTLYTLVMVDLDAPSPTDPYEREYLHWLVINIPGTMEARNGQELVRYESPRPGSTGIHRITFVLFRQTRYEREIDPPGWRQNFNTRDFAEIYGLGSPVAALYFNCQGQVGRNNGRRRPL